MKNCKLSGKSLDILKWKKVEILERVLYDLYFFQDLDITFSGRAMSVLWPNDRSCFLMIIFSANK